MVKSLDQFEQHGCDNCERYLSMKDDRETAIQATTAKFDGMISLMNPGESWVAKWQRIRHCVPGIYAIGVYGKLPSSLRDTLRNQNIKWRQNPPQKR